MMKTMLTFFMAFILSVSAYAENENKGKNAKTAEKTEEQAVVKISGNVIDEERNETLAGAAVYIDNQKVYSDLDGNYIVTNIVPGKHRLKVELISYKTVENEIEVFQDSKIPIQLSQE
jgi:hypothetical protein